MVIHRSWGAAVALALLVASIHPSTASAAGSDATCRGKKATIVGTDRGDVLRGTSGPDVIVGLGGLDEIYGRGGNDIICTGGGSEDLYWRDSQTVDGGRGRDVIVGSRASDHLVGGPGADRLLGRGHDDTLFGSDGDDILRGGRGQEWLAGDNGNDRVSGGRGNDQVRGNAGDDYISGGRGSDMLAGGFSSGQNGLGPGWFHMADGLRERGADRVDGGPGGDFVVLGRDPDLLNGGGGVDTLVYRQPDKEPSEDLVVDLANGVISGGGGGRDRVARIEHVNALADADITLIGDEKSNRLFAGTKSDADSGYKVKLIGGAGDDMVASVGAPSVVLRGQGGADILWEDACQPEGPLIAPAVIEGGRGADEFYSECPNEALVGGPGADTFRVQYEFGQQLDGGTGFDVLTLVTGAMVVADLSQDSAEVGGTVMTLNGIEGLVSGGGNDSLTGDEADNLLDSSGGQDRLDGNEGSDRCLNGEIVTECESDSAGRG